MIGRRLRQGGPGRRAMSGEKDVAPRVVRTTID
jgi:hypothetical protein